MALTSKGQGKIKSAMLKRYEKRCADLEAEVMGLGEDLDCALGLIHEAFNIHSEMTFVEISILAREFLAKYPIEEEDITPVPLPMGDDPLDRAIGVLRDMIWMTKTLKIEEEEEDITPHPASPMAIGEEQDSTLPTRLQPTAEISFTLGEPVGYMRPCDRCGGSGIVIPEHFNPTCPDCDGTGIFTEADSDG